MSAAASPAFRSEMLAQMGIDDGFVALSVNVRFGDCAALGLPGINSAAIAAEWAELLKNSFPSAGIGTIRYGRGSGERDDSCRLTDSVRALLADAREAGKLVDRQALKDLGYRFSER